MKAVFNGNTSRAIPFTTFNRRLNLENATVDFDITFDMSASSNAASALTVYAKEPITHIELLNDEGEVLIDMDDIHAELTGFYETLSSEYYNASANIVVYSAEE